ncbi:MAG TPA: G8 domain-containing protein [Archangium sp.]|nr:G8 domain-containing protein [Archangium sp.]
MHLTSLHAPRWRARSLLSLLLMLLATACNLGAQPPVVEPPVVEPPGGEPTPPVPPAPRGACAELPPRPPAPQVRRWSDAATWGGNKPQAGATLTIPHGTHVLLDEQPPPLALLSVHGTLEFDERDVELQVGSLHVHGALYVGSASRPFSHRAVITLTGTDEDSRGLHVQGGRLELCGQPPSVLWTRLGDHAPAGSTQLTLERPVDWRPGDELVLAPTDFYGRGASERLTVASVDGARVTLSTPLATARWGRLQHVTSQGMSLSPDATFVPPASPTPTVLDERAEVGHLTRNILVQGADDTRWRQDGFGANLMVMGAGAVAALDGVQLRRAGQAGLLGRYPVHFHLLSYDAQGAERASGPVHVWRSTVAGSSNRCMVLHATSGARLRDNVCFDIQGHAFFLEDAVERRNVLERNLALKVRAPPAARRLQVHEGEVFQAGPSGFWLTNPDNTVRGNAAADAQGNGFWLAFPSTALGASTAVPLKPKHLAFGTFEDNVAHSNRAPGLNLDWVPVDAAGNVTPDKYFPTSDGQFGYDTRVRFKLSRITTYKNNDHGFWNRATFPDYEEWVSADNVGTFFAGAGDGGRITRSLLVARSLNTPTAAPSSEAPVAVASYHSSFDIDRNVFVGFDFVPGQASGVFRTDDYYIRAVDKGLTRNPNNRLVASHPGFRTPPVLQENWTLAGALWDAHGYFGPAGRFWVYDMPFLTHGGACTPVLPAGQNGQSCEGPYFGVGGFVLNRANQRWSPMMPLRVERQDATGARVGEWTVGDGNLAPKLGNMRHFAARAGGRYVLTFPGLPPPSDVSMAVENAPGEQDSFVLGVAFDGARRAAAYLTTRYHYESFETVAPDSPDAPAWRGLRAAANLQEVLDSNGDRFWQDTANHRVWVKYRGGLRHDGLAGADPMSDDALYRPVYLRVHPAP